MSIAQTATTSFKVQLFQAVHNFGPASPNVFKIALYNANANLGPDTTAYSTSNEISGAGYTEGGNVLVTSVFPTSGNNAFNIPTAFISFENAQWPNATFTCRGALIYNDTVVGKPSVAVLDFGADKTVNNDIFNVIFPTPNASNAIVRIS